MLPSTSCYMVGTLVTKLVSPVGFPGEHKITTTTIVVGILNYFILVQTRCKYKNTLCLWPLSCLYNTGGGNMPSSVCLWKTVYHEVEGAAPRVEWCWMLITGWILWRKWVVKSYLITSIHSYTVLLVTNLHNSPCFH